jgi:ribosomal protein S14
MHGTSQREQIYVYDTCQVCGEENALVYLHGDKLMCASDARAWIRQNPTKQTCDKCGTEANVFRDPSHRRNEYLCLDCHNENGFRPNNTVANRAFRELMEGTVE